MATGNLAIAVSGGPAPGINSVISSVTISAEKVGRKVYGLRGGFDAVVEAPANELLIELRSGDVSRIHATGGSILGTSRSNPFLKERGASDLDNLLASRGIDRIIVIGGDGSAYLSYLISQRLPRVRVAHVPKTIDNDLILPAQAPSFGFETARQAGTNTLMTIAEDAKTCRRWFVVTTMGRKAGFLALGLGIASGCITTLIPEGYEGKTIRAAQLAEEIMSSMRVRRKMGRDYGVVLVAEGVLDLIDPASSPELREAPRDHLGRLNYSEVDLSDVLHTELGQRRREEGFASKVVFKDIGYELRCHPPVSFDIEYTRFLGWGAVEVLERGDRGVMVTREFDRLGTVPLIDMVLPGGGMKSRRVDISSDLYRMAQKFMVR